MAIKNIHGLLVTGLTYLLDFEERIGEAAPKMASASADSDLKDAFEKTRTKSKDYAAAVETAFKELGVPAKRAENHIAKAMVHEVEGMIEGTEQGPVRDAALIVAANQQQQFRVASYGSMQSYAKLIGKENALTSLKDALEDSKNGDRKFTSIGEGGVNQQAAKAA